MLTISKGGNMAWITANWVSVLAALWAIDQLLVSLLGKSTVLDTVTSILKGLGAGK
jgi:hypothetical protein